MLPKCIGGASFAAEGEPQRAKIRDWPEGRKVLAAQLEEGQALGDGPTRAERHPLRRGVDRGLTARMRVPATGDQGQRPRGTVLARPCVESVPLGGRPHPGGDTIDKGGRQRGDRAGNRDPAKEIENGRSAVVPVVKRGIHKRNPEKGDRVREPKPEGAEVLREGSTQPPAVSDACQLLPRLPHSRAKDHQVFRRMFAAST